jgi:hypothetical protein
MLKFESCIKSPRAEFSYRSYGHVIAVVDHDHGRSVTNDAEAVIAQLAEKFDLSKFHVIYRDTRGVWDELLVQHGQFVGFRSINERELEAALAKVT